MPKGKSAPNRAVRASGMPRPAVPASVTKLAWARSGCLARAGSNGPQFADRCWQHERIGEDGRKGGDCCAQHGAKHVTVSAGDEDGAACAEQQGARVAHLRTTKTPNPSALDFSFLG